MAPHCVVIGEVKRGDIANSAAADATAMLPDGGLTPLPSMLDVARIPWSLGWNVRNGAFLFGVGVSSMTPAAGRIGRSPAHPGNIVMCGWRAGCGNGRWWITWGWWREQRRRNSRLSSGCSVRSCRCRIPAWARRVGNSAWRLPPDDVVRSAGPLSVCGIVFQRGRLP